MSTQVRRVWIEGSQGLPLRECGLFLFLCALGCTLLPPSSPSCKLVQPRRIKSVMRELFSLSLPPSRAFWLVNVVSPLTQSKEEEEQRQFHNLIHLSRYPRSEDSTESSLLHHTDPLVQGYPRAWTGVCAPPPVKARFFFKKAHPPALGRPSGDRRERASSRNAGAASPTHEKTFSQTGAR